MFSAVFGLLTLTSLGLTLWQWLEARRFPLHRRSAEGSFAPPVTLLKPLKGADAETAACLRSWLQQDYAGPVQILFGVETDADPAAAVVRQLLREHPACEARLVVCAERRGANAKVSKLSQLEPWATHAVWVVSDADVRVPPDFLTHLVAPFQTGRGAARAEDGKRAQPAASAGAETAAGQEALTTGAAEGQAREGGAVVLVNPFYRLANPSTVAMRWEALAINADFWSSVLQARRLQPLDFALGAVMAVRREAVAKVGGLLALVNHLADDFELGHRLARQGGRVEVCPVVVDCWEVPQGWRAVWQHQLRWARTIRVCRPGPYALSLLSNATLWPLLWAALAPGPASLLALPLAMVVRVLTAADNQGRLTQSRAHWPWLWLAPFKDLLQASLWLLAFGGNTVEWRGERYRVQAGGQMVRLPRAAG